MTAFVEPEGVLPVGLSERVRVEVSVRVGDYPAATVLEVGRVYELVMGRFTSRGVLEGVKASVRDGSVEDVSIYLYDPAIGSCGYALASVHALASLEIGAGAWCDARMAPYYNQSVSHD